jgi:hypothetical protein
MTEPFFDRERLDAYRLAIEYVASSYRIAKSLNGAERHARDQWLRAAQSIPLNIAEGNGKRQRETKSQGQESIFRDRARLSFGMRCDSRYTRIIRSDRSSTSTSTAMLSTSTRKRTNKALDRSARSARSDMVTFSPRTRSMRLIVADTQAFFLSRGFKRCNGILLND